jgi:hypothetical protein
MVDIRDHGIGIGKYRVNSILTGVSDFAPATATFLNKGKKHWHKQSTNPTHSDMLYFEDENMIVRANTGASNNVQGLDMNGNVIWNYTLPSYKYGTLEKSYDGKIFLFTSNGYVVKLNTDGTEVYNKTHAALSNTTGTKFVVEDKDGNFIISNWQNTDSPNSTYPVLEKYDANFNLIWSFLASNYPSPIMTSYYSQIVDSDSSGGFVVNHKDSRYTSGNHYIRYYDSNGVYVWQLYVSYWKQSGYENYQSRISKIFMDRDTNRTWIVFGNYVDDVNRAIEVYSSTGSLIKKFTGANFSVTSDSYFGFQGFNYPNKNFPDSITIGFGRDTTTEYRMIHINRSTLAVISITLLSSLPEFYSSAKLGNSKSVIVDKYGDIYMSVIFTTGNYYLLKQLGRDIATIVK